MHETTTREHGDREKCFEDEVQRLLQDLVHSEQSHFEAASAWGRVHLTMGIAVAGGAALAAAFARYELNSVSVAVGVGASLLAAVLTATSAAERGERHRSAGNRYLRLRGQARRFQQLDWPQMHGDQARARLEELCAAKADLNSESPGIPRWAYLLGKKRIDAGEVIHSVDEAATTPQE